MLGPELPDDNQDAALINRGMRLNEAKKLKREKLKAEEAVRLQEEAAGLQPTTEQNKEKKTPQKAQPKSKPQAEAQAVQPQPQPSKPAESLPTRPDPLAEQQEAVQIPIVEEPAPALEPTAKSGPKQKKQTKPKTTSAPDTIQTEEVPAVTILAQPEPIAEALTPPEVTQAAQPEPTTETVTTRKRKRDAATPAVEQPSAEPIVESPDVLSLPRNGPQPKKLKLNFTAPPPAETPTITVSTRAIAAAKDVSSPSNANTPAVSSPRISVRQKSQRSQRNSAQPETQNGSSEAAAQTPAANTRGTRPTTITLKHSATKAASAEPANTRQSLRRSSIASLPGSANNKLRSPAPGNVATAADTNTGRRPQRRKPPMGILQAEEYGTKVIVGKPKAASKKKKKTEVKGEAATPVIEDEMIDPDEPRYCICGDVSHGTMIACDNEAVSSSLNRFSSYMLTLTGLVRDRVVPSRMCWSDRAPWKTSQVVLPNLSRKAEERTGQEWHRRLISKHDLMRRLCVHLPTTQGGVLYAITTSRYPVAALAFSNTNYSERPDTISRPVLRRIRYLGSWQ